MFLKLSNLLYNINCNLTGKLLDQKSKKYNLNYLLYNICFRSVISTYKES